MDNVETKPLTEYSEQEIISNGARIVLSIWVPPNPTATLVFIPATMVHPLFFEPLLKGFAEQGFAVVGLHPVGHGKSTRDVKRYTIRDIVQNGRDAVSFALERFALPVVVMGSSQGGIVAAALAAEDERIAAVFAHNIMLSELPDSIGVSRFPLWLRHLYRPLRVALRLFACLFPDWKVPLKYYLDRKRISTNLAVWNAVRKDALNLTRYPLCFVASLLTTDFPGLTDGKGIRCPVYVIADSGDKLFTPAYTQKVFERLRAPYKEMIEFDYHDHMLMVTHAKEVCAALSVKIKEALASCAVKK